MAAQQRGDARIELNFPSPIVPSQMISSLGTRATGDPINFSFVISQRGGFYGRQILRYAVSIHLFFPVLLV
jgi:hypothetical protein